VALGALTANAAKEIPMLKILMVLTSHDRLGDTGKKTGFWLEEFAAPYYVFKDAEADVTLASPSGAGVLAHVKGVDYDAVFYPGGHGPLWDLPDDAHSIAVIEGAIAAGRPVGLVCHAPAALKNAKSADGLPLVKGRKVTGYSNSEEAAVGLTDVVPFLVEDMLKANGADYAKGPDFGSFAVQDGPLITGQNPASSAAAARIVLAQLGVGA
jgi:putative intracellular protease/amidase